MKKIAAILLVCLPIFVSSQSLKVKTGEQAIDFTLNQVDGKQVQLSKLYAEKPVVLIVLRGWPEYQCPVCTRQVGEFIAEADQLEANNATVLFVYPGPSEVLPEKAKEFASDFTFPDDFYFTLDPNYSMVNKYGLRWNAPKETAYPSAFVIDTDGKIVFSKVSSSHGDRADVEEVVAALKDL